MAKPRKKKTTTLLVVGEGKDDEAFIKHMQQLYCLRGSGRSIHIRAGDGGSAGNIITHAIRKYCNAEYGQRLLVLDSDLPPTPAEDKKAQKAGYSIVLWRPQSLEGALLDVLGESVKDHETSQALKNRLHPRLSGHHTDPKAYRDLFPKPKIDDTSNLSVSTVRNALIGK